MCFGYVLIYIPDWRSRQLWRKKNVPSHECTPVDKLKRYTLFDEHFSHAHLVPGLKTSIYLRTYCHMQLRNVQHLHAECDKSVHGGAAGPAGVLPRQRQSGEGRPAQGSAHLLQCGMSTLFDARRGHINIWTDKLGLSNVSCRLTGERPAYTGRNG